MSKIAWLLVFVPISFGARLAGADTLVFVTATVAVIPLAGFMGKGTEELALHTGPRLGGLLNASLGNSAELIIGFFLILEGEIDVVKASIAGSIIGNILLVLGLSFLVGGIRHREQSFDSKVAGMHSASLVLAVIGLLMLALFHQASPDAGLATNEVVSVGVAIVLISVYVFSIVYSFATNQKVVTAPTYDEQPKWSRRTSTLVLVGATVLVAFESEMLVSSLEHAVEALGLPKLFIGLILIPIVGNAAEHGSAVLLAAKNKVDIAIEIAVGSGTQIALLIAPLLVFLSLAAGTPMDLFFNGFEIAAVGFSTAIVALISLDGKSNWLEGTQLIAAYLIMALSFLFLEGV